jgi:hypothetical protein
VVCHFVHGGGHASAQADRSRKQAAAQSHRPFFTQAFYLVYNPFNQNIVKQILPNFDIVLTLDS